MATCENEILVSIVCAAYNHENYIRDAIESFLLQKTDFAYEILIHDDASDDRTTEIIKDYESRYPDLIKPVYQTENQYSKGINVNRLNLERAMGKYIATCEGDDYWLDPHKLQKQVNYMENHPECSLCVHAAYRVKPDKTKIKPHVRPNRGNKILTVEEIILGGGGFFAANTKVYRALFNNNRPDFIDNSPVGDYPIAIYLALCGTVYYIDEFMSVYRAGVPGSWTSRQRLLGMDKQIEHNNRGFEMLNAVNSFSEYKYDGAIKKKIKKMEFGMMLSLEKYEKLKAKEYREVYHSLGSTEKVKIFLKQYFPRITKNLIELKRKVGRNICRE